MRPRDVKRIILSNIAEEQKTLRPPVIQGSSGIGKTEMIFQICRETGFEPVYLPLGEMDVPTVIGGMHIDHENKVTHLCPPAIMPRKSGKYLIFVDELTSAKPLVQLAAHQFLSFGTLGEWSPPEGSVCIRVGAGNGTFGDVINYDMKEPVRKRVCIIDMECNVEDWTTDYAYPNDLHPDVIGYLNIRPDVMSTEVKGKNGGSPRTWTGVSAILKNIPQDLQQEAIEGQVGEVNASEFAAWRDLKKVMPDPRLVMQNKDVPVPDRMDVRYAMVSSLIALVETPKNIDSMISYLRKYQKNEYLALAIRLLRSKCPQMTLESTRLRELATDKAFREMLFAGN